MGAVKRDAKSAHHDLGGHAGAHRLLTVHLDVQPRPGRFDVPVDVHHARRALEDRPHLLGEVDAPLEVRPVDLRHEGREHRRSGRHLRDLDVGTGPPGDRCEKLSDGDCKWVASTVAFAFRAEVHLEVGHERTRAQEIVAHEAVEVEGARSSHVHLDVGDLGQRANRPRELARRGGSGLQRGPSRHVHYDLNLALVVVRQHLDRHEFEEHEADGCQKQHDDASQQRPASPRPLEQRCEHPFVETMEPPFLRGFRVGPRAL